MRVLFVNRMASMVRGGGETFDVEIARHLDTLGCRITFLTGLPLFSGPRLPYSDFGFQVSGFSVRTPYFGWFPWDRVRGGWRLRLADFYLFERAAARWAARRAGEFDVIQVCELPTFVSLWKQSRHRVPVIMRLTAPDYHDPGGAIHAADAVIASGATMRRVREMVRSDCEDIPNGVDTTMFKPQLSSFRSEMGIPAEAPVVLFVARFQVVKNHRMLLEAVSRARSEVRALRLVLAGSGPLEAEIRNRCRELGLQDTVHFLGEVPFHRVPALYAAADMNVISSDYESFSFATLEAMATALPVIATDTDWIPSLLGDDGSRKGQARAVPGGEVVPVGDAPAMARALVRLATDAESRRRMGAWNRARAEADFGWSASAARLLALYRRVTERD